MRYVGWFLLAGCLAKPPRPDRVASTGPACTRPTIKETFDAPFDPVCGVGFSDTNPASTSTRGGGVLHFQPAAELVNDASCTWDSFDFAEGAFVELRQPLATGGSYTMLQVEHDGTAIGLSVTDDTAPVLELFDLPHGVVASIDYDPSEMAWLRLRPEGGLVTGEYSAEGARWFVLGSSQTAAPTQLARVSLNGGVYNPLAAPGEAEFDNFDVCP